MAEKEPPDSQKPTEGGQGTPGHQIGPTGPFFPYLEQGPQRLEPSEPELGPVPHRLDPFSPPPSDDVEPAPLSDILQAPPPERRIRGIGWGQGTNPNPSTESADTYRERVAPENRPSGWWKSFDLPEAPDEKPDK